MSLLDATYGSYSSMSGSRFYGTGGAEITADQLSPATTPSPSGAKVAPSRPLADEPGAGVTGTFNPRTLLDNPTTWLVVTLAAAIAAARYAANGSVL